MATSFITLCLGLAKLVLTASSDTDQNRIDVSIFKLLRHPGLFQVTDDCRNLWFPIIEKVVLALSDQQILTGLSIIIIGFVTQCSISAYHFAIVDDMAWFSANVHLTGLGILRGYLSQRPVHRNWRIYSMVVLAIFILASTVMQGHWAYYLSWSFDAHCLFNNLEGNVSGQPGIWMWVDLVAITIIYPMSMLPLYEKSMSFVQERIYDNPMHFLDVKIGFLEDEELQRQDHSSVGATAWRLFLSTIQMTYFWFATLITSRCTIYLIDLAWFGYGVANVISNRKIPASEMVGDEDIMTFGQLLPILLLSSTVLVFKEAYQGKCLANESVISGARS